MEHDGKRSSHSPRSRPLRKDGEAERVAAARSEAVRGIGIQWQRCVVEGSVERVVVMWLGGSGCFCGQNRSSLRIFKWPKLAICT